MQALADIANGLQAIDFQTLVRKARQDLAVARVQFPPLPKKLLTKKVAEERNANKHAIEASKQHPGLVAWIPRHKEEIARSWLAAAEFSNVQIARVELLVSEQGHAAFDIETIRTVVRSLGMDAGSGTLAGTAAAAAPDAVEWASELVGLKKKVTTAEEARAEQAVAQALAICANGPHQLPHTSSAPAVVDRSPSNDAAGSNQAASLQRPMQNSAAPTAGSVAPGADMQFKAELVLSSSAPAAVQSAGSHPAAFTNSHLWAPAAVKRKLDERCESAPDDGLDPGEPSPAHARPAKVSKEWLASSNASASGGPDQAAGLSTGSHASLPLRSADRATLLYAISYSDIRVHFFSPVRTAIVICHHQPNTR